MIQGRPIGSSIFFARRAKELIVRPSPASLSAMPAVEPSPDRAEQQPKSDEQLARGVAETLFDHEGDVWPEVEERWTADFAQTAVETLARLHRERGRGIYRKVFRRARRIASSQTEHRYQGVLEVVQNADDQGATFLSIDVEDNHIRFSHDGRRVGVRDILPMAFPYVTNKGDRADTTGRFGIGLKTLDRLGSPLTVDSKPYHFSISRDDLEWIGSPSPAAQIGAGSRTYLSLALNPDVDVERLGEWLQGLDDTVLLFLRSVKAIRIRLGAANKELRLAGKRATRLPGGITSEVLTATDGRMWTRF